MVKNQKDFYAGLMFGVVGAAFAWGATSYTIGNAARMGPGYFPLVLGIILALLGAAIVIESLMLARESDGGKIGAWAWRPLLYIIGANLAFGVLLGGLPRFGIPAMGLIAAIFALTLIAAKAGEEYKFKEVIILAAILAVGSYLVFIKLLNLQMPVWPAFLTA